MSDKEEKRVVTLDFYEEGAVITALNDMRNKAIAEDRPANFEAELIMKILNAPQQKAKTRRFAKSLGTNWGGEEQQCEADTRCKAGVAKHGLRQRDEAR